MQFSPPAVEKHGLWKIISLKEFRNTPGVQFHVVPINKLGHIDSIDRVFHQHSALSPGPIGDVTKPWYMHPHQVDNLLVFAGDRTTELYNPETHQIETFNVTPERICDEHGQVLFDGPAILSWPCGVFHRVSSGEKGSMSINFAVHSPGWDVHTNFSIYKLDIQTGAHQVIREGSADQRPLHDD